MQYFPRIIPLCLLSFALLSPAFLKAEQDVSQVTDGMVLIPSGSFTMGGDAGLMDGGSQSHGTSYPIHEVTLDGFWLDETEVTNREFAKFAEATGYVTFAERPLPKEMVAELKRMAAQNIGALKSMAERSTGTEREEILQEIERVQIASAMNQNAGSMVFTAPVAALTSADNITQWWRIDPGANWRAPEGPGSSWEDRLDHPVVNVNRDDATAYATWAGKRLPTEAEWERAARSGLERQPYVWGPEFSPEGAAVWMANIWQGVWPYENSGDDGFVLTAPVKSFRPNAFGLYDVAGNVWEIVADHYHPSAYSMRAKSVVNPTGPDQASLNSLRQRVPTYVTRGGSFLCSDSWCSGYQPGSRQPQEADSPAHHTGFRCAMDVK